MRVCFLSRRFFPAISGMSVYALNLLRELVAGGHDVVMISQYRNDSQGAAVYGGGPPPDVTGVEVIGLESVGEQVVNHGRPADFEGDIGDIVRAVEEAHSRKPFDIIHAQYGYPTGLAALEASRRLGIPNVVSIQGGDGHWVGTCCKTHKDAMLAVLEHANALLIGSRSFAEEVVNNHGIGMERFTIVPGATDVHRFQPRDLNAIGRLSAIPTLLYHGRVDVRKGLMELLEAFRMVHPDFPTLGMVISGIGPDVNVVKKYVEDVRLSSHIQLTGYASYAEAPRVYHRGDIFVSPTYSEGFSNTILEAMASGLPVVSTSTIGVVDCLQDGYNGLLVPVRDVESLADAIRQMLIDDEMRIHVAQQGYTDVQKLYSWPAVGRQIQSIYEDVARVRPDNKWVDIYDATTVTVESADLSCRFRAQPHLL
ncbi:MAG: glycosyltransferase family 4 protein [Gemmataceae bacterium]